jgi:hypothetical protein
MNSLENDEQKGQGSDTHCDSGRSGGTDAGIRTGVGVNGDGTNSHNNVHVNDNGFGLPMY